MYEVAFFLQWYKGVVALVEYIPHHLRHNDDSPLCLLRVDVYQGVYVVESVHKEVRVYLIFQISQLLFQVLFLQVAQLLLVFVRLEKQLHTEVHSKHQHQDKHIQDKHLRHYICLIAYDIAFEIFYLSHHHRSIRCQSGMKKILQKCKSNHQNNCSPNITTTPSVVNNLRQQQEIVYNERTKKH